MRPLGKIIVLILIKLINEQKLTITCNNVSAVCDFHCAASCFLFSVGCNLRILRGAHQSWLLHLMHTRSTSNVACSVPCHVIWLCHPSNCMNNIKYIYCILLQKQQQIHKAIGWWIKFFYSRNESRLYVMSKNKIILCKH